MAQVRSSCNGSAMRLVIALFALVACTTPESKASTAKPTTSGAVASAAVVSGLQDGDLVFQTSKSSQSAAIQLATHSKFSHVGIVYQNARAPFVYEAIGPVTSTPLATWIARGEGRHYTAKRLADRSKLDAPTLAAMRAAGKKYAGKPYDFTFEWSDDRIYCSELVWKIFHEGAGIDLAPLAKLRDFDLSSPTVKTAIAQRYGANVPLDETVISPQALADSPFLVTVEEK